MTRSRSSSVASIASTASSLGSHFSWDGPIGQEAIPSASAAEARRLAQNRLMDEMELERVAMAEQQRKAIASLDDQIAQNKVTLETARGCSNSHGVEVALNQWNELHQKRSDIVKHRINRDEGLWTLSNSQ